MTIIPNHKETDNAIFKCCQHFIKRFQINTLLREVNATKEKGIPAYEIFAFLMGLVFSGKNLFAVLNTCPEKISFGKDCVYRFLSKGSINWNASPTQHETFYGDYLPNKKIDRRRTPDGADYR